MTKQEIGAILMRLREQSGKSREEVADLLGKSVKTVGHWETGYAQPDANTLFLLCTIYDADLNTSFGFPAVSRKNAPLYSSEAEKLARDYDSLDRHGKKAVRAVADVEIARCAELAQAAPARDTDETVYYITSWFYRPMSAGTGEQAGDEQPENLRLVKEPPPGTSYVAPINGDSMEPTYHSGDKLFIHACEEIEPGQIGVFYMDGQQWVKELGDGVLISHNPNYPPRPMTEDVRCQGLVLGVCDESYFE